MPNIIPATDNNKYSATQGTAILLALIFVLGGCISPANSEVVPTPIPLTATSAPTVTQPQMISISPTATLKNGMLELNNQGQSAFDPTGNGSCSPGTNIVQGTIIVPVTRSNMAGTQYHFILPDGTLIDASEIPDGMCATATGPVDECTGLATGAVGLDFEDAGLPLVECSQLRPDH